MKKYDVDAYTVGTTMVDISPFAVVALPIKLVKTLSKAGGSVYRIVNRTAVDTIPINNTSINNTTDVLAINRGTSGPKYQNIEDNFDEIVSDIINTNKKYSDGYEMNNSIENIVNSALYYDDPVDQVSAITRSITDHAFVDGNKRTAFDTMNSLMDNLGLSNNLTDTQKWDLIYDIAEGVIRDVDAISNILKG